MKTRVKRINSAAFTTTISSQLCNVPLGAYGRVTRRNSINLHWKLNLVSALLLSLFEAHGTRTRSPNTSIGNWSGARIHLSYLRSWSQSTTAREVRRGACVYVLLSAAAFTQSPGHVPSHEAIERLKTRHSWPIPKSAWGLWKGCSLCVRSRQRLRVKWGWLTDSEIYYWTS